jgi:Helicase
VPFKPVTPAERLAAFERLNFRPHGLFMPEDEDGVREVMERIKWIGARETPDARLQAYHAFQDETELWSQNGIEGHWTGQQALARSTARFRIAAWGRRGGKTTEAAMEAIGVATMRPRSWIWLAAPTMKLVSRAFDKVMEVVRDLNLKTRTVRDTTQEKLCVLENGARLEGISLENIWSAAGAAIDLAIIDEAAQIYPEAWARAILPPLTDRNGQALLISSWEGEGDFFHQKAIDARADMVAHGGEAAWEMFQDASYDINFYAFPQGRQTPALQQAAKEMEPHEFLEQFGGIPASARERVFPEFKEKVHVTDVAYNPDLPVILAVDPSGGSNAYAILAIQEYTDMTVIFDEIYETHRSTEEIAEILASRDWLKANLVSAEGELLPHWEVEGVSDMIVDSAQPEEMRRWQRMGFPAYIIEKKPQVWERIPFMRNQVRDPVRFFRFYRNRINLILESMDREPDTDHELTAEEQKALTIQVEEGLNDEHLVGQTLQYLRSCARLRVDRRCTATINEFKTYTYPKRRRLNMNYQEKPRDWMNHAMDAWGYYVWVKKRFEGEPESASYSYLETHIEPLDDEEAPDVLQRQPPPEVVARTPLSRGRMFMEHVRGFHERGPYEPHSYLEVAAR